MLTIMLSIKALLFVSTKLACLLAEDIDVLENQRKPLHLVTSS